MNFFFNNHRLSVNISINPDFSIKCVYTFLYFLANTAKIEFRIVSDIIRKA